MIKKRLLDCVRAQNGPPKIRLVEKNAGYDPPDVFIAVYLVFSIIFYYRSGLPNYYKMGTMILLFFSSKEGKSGMEKLERTVQLKECLKR